MRPKNAEVPPHFRCPISFELMEDPVILCTGITYDRASIVRWLDDGNQFCPVTKQLLCSKELIPNCTLQHLISSWCSTNLPPAPAQDGSGAARTRTTSQLVQFVENADRGLDYDSLVALSRCSVGHSVWKKAVESQGFWAALVAPFHDRTGPLPGEEQRLCILWKMSQQLQHGRDGVAEMLSDCLGYRVLVSLLDKHNSSRTRVLAAQLLEKLGSGEEVSSCTGLVNGLLELLRPDVGSLSDLETSEEEEKQQVVQETALRCLVKACNSRLGNKIEAIRLGAVTLLVDLLVTTRACKKQPARTKTKQYNNKSKSGKASGVVEYALALLRAMSSCAEGREALAALHDKAMQAILNDLLKSSAQSVEHGVIVLWTCLAHSDKFDQSFLEADGLVTMAMVLQSDCTPLAKLKAADVLKHFSWLWKEQA